MLTQAELKELVSYDPDTGVFTLAKVRRRTTRKLGDPLGSVTKAGYLETVINQKKYYLHRLAFLYMTGELPNGIVDHRNRNKSDNRWANLSVGTQQDNVENNISPRKNNSSGYLGVHKFNNKFKAKIVHKQKQIHLGTFDTAKEAADAYLKAKPLIHTKFYVGIDYDTRC